MTDIVKRLAKCAAVSEIVGDNSKIYYDAAHEITRLRRAMHDIYEVYAGSEGGLYENSIYTLDLVKEMAAIAAEHK